jgi:hypothetical protein
MKSQHLGLRITQAPGTDHITVEPDEKSEGGVHVLIKIVGMQPLSFGIEELSEFISALTVAENHARFMIDRNTKQDSDE